MMIVPAMPLGSGDKSRTLYGKKRRQRRTAKGQSIVRNGLYLGAVYLALTDHSNGANLQVSPFLRLLRKFDSSDLWCDFD